MKIKMHVRVVFSFLVLSFLVACGGSSSPDDPDPPVVQGQFIDSVVSGLSYKTPTMSGFTTNQGRFNYRRGEMVRFFVGDVFIGEAMGQAVITPIELVASAVDENNDQVLNIAIFLQSIDEDADESNGINITASANAAAAGGGIDFTLPASEFDSDGGFQTLISLITGSDGEARMPVSRDQARSAFRGNLLGLLAGEYRGTFSGDDRGSWVATVDGSGDITGTSRSDLYEVEDIIGGTLSSSGQVEIRGTVGTSVFTGAFSRDGKASGSWLNDDGDTGTFSGSRVVAPPVDSGNSGSLAVSGGDASVIGVSFTPSLDPAILDFGTGDIVVTWAQQIFSSSEFESRSMFFAFNENDGSLKTIGYIRLTGSDPAAKPTSFYSYGLDCENAPQSCSSVLLDGSQRKVTFNSTSLAADTDGYATGAIVLTGTLAW